MKRAYVWVVGMAVTGLVTAAVCAWSQAQHDSSAQRVASSLAVADTTSSTSSVSHLDNMRAAIDVYGQIAQEPEHVTHITSPEPAVVQSILVNVDQIVDPDTPLCIIRTKKGLLQAITSPIHGVVFAQYAKPGVSVDPVSSILTIADMDSLRGIFHVYERDVAWVRLGQKMVVKSIAYPDRDFTAEVVFISPQVDEETHTIHIRATIHNDEHLLRFGMLVTGRILVSASPGASTVTIWKKPSG